MGDIKMGLARKINMSDDKVVPFKIPEQPDIKKRTIKIKGC